MFSQAILFFLSVSIEKCDSLFEIVSPDELKQEISHYAYANFGNPGYFSMFGKLVPIHLTACTFSAPLESSSFGLVYWNSTLNCPITDLALSVQSSGGSALVLVLPDDNTFFYFTPDNATKAAETTIVVLGISFSLGNTLLSFTEEEIWTTYYYPTSFTAEPVLTYYLTSNYTLDQTFFTALKTLSDNVAMLHSEFRLGFIDDIYSKLNPDFDCLTTALGDSYCVPHDGTITGAQKLSNSIIFMNYYNSLTGTTSVNKLVTLVLNVYAQCLNDYSNDCLSVILQTLDITANTSTSVLGVLSNNSRADYVFYEIDGIFFYSLAEFEFSYCLSSSSPGLSCSACSSACPYSDLYSVSCIESCNISSCGYQFLTCMEEDNCYSFMLGDGNCNAQCLDDPDCSSSKSVVTRTQLIIILVVILVGVFM